MWQRIIGFVPSRLMLFSDVLFGYARLSKKDRGLKLSSGFADHRQDQAHRRSNPDHLRRIISAYKASKTAQEQAAAAFQVRGMWAEMVNMNFQPLTRALQNEDLSALAALLENFNREQFTSGSGGTGYEQGVLYRSSPIGRPYIKTMWSRYRDLLRGLDFDLGNVHFPLVGNPTGIMLNQDVIQINVFRHIYHAVEMREWLRDRTEATVVEIGGGAGGQAYQTMRLAGESVAKYVIFDIPEVAVIISYFLLTSFPEKRIRLFGEGAVSVDKTETYDLAIFPHFAISQLSDQSVDLYHNACSFSEMDGAASSQYLKIIERTGRRYFSHINHDLRYRVRNPDGSISVSIIGSELIPDQTRFKRLFKKPRVFSLPEDRPYHPAYEYLYERMRITPDSPTIERR